MFTRIVETRAKAGKRQEMSRIVAEQILPILQKQTGFVDLLALTKTDDPDQLISISVWKSQQEADRYQREQFKNIEKILNPVVDRELSVRTYDVQLSTAYRISAGKAA